MSIFAERSAADLVLERRRYGDPEVVALVELVQAEYVVRYGGPDETPMDPAQFDPPAGLFLVGTVAGAPVGCGGWRAHDEGDVELKRMFVIASARRRGYARALLTGLEDAARVAGKRRIMLETGDAQPEAVAMYERAGYRPAAKFGHYRDAASAIHMAKML